jgi:iron(III) transport system ATP-binding protein
MADLRVTDLALRRGEAEILQGASVTLPAGKTLALLGPSGSGKTTLLRAIAGLETPYRGSIRLGERVLYDAERRIDLPPEARGLGLVLRSYALWPHRTVHENIAYGLRRRRVAAAETRTRVAGILEQIGLTDVAGQYPLQLTPDQQQRVALARALIYEPEVVLLDDPFSGLDARLREPARGRLRHLIAARKVSAVMVTHDQVEAMAIADRVALLNCGLVEQEGSPVDLFRDPANMFVAEFMGTNNRLEGTLVENTDTHAAIEVMGMRLAGVARSTAAKGSKATGLIRPDKVTLGGGPGANRILMTIKAQMYLGERWEVLFAKDDLTVRAYVSAPLKHELYHVELPAHALWIF